MKMRAPEGTTSISIEGHDHFVDEDGLIEVEDRLVETLESHGFVPYIDPAGMPHGELVSRLVDRARQKLQTMSHDELLAAYQGIEREIQAAQDELVHVETVTAEAIEAMPRGELFSFLRQKGVAVGAASNEVLRKAALEVIGAVAPDPAPDANATAGKENTTDVSEQPMIEDDDEAGEATPEAPALADNAMAEIPENAIGQ